MCRSVSPIISLTLCLDRVVHFFAVYGNPGGRLDAHTNPFALDIDDRDFHVVTNHDRFIFLT